MEKDPQNQRLTQIFQKVGDSYHYGAVQAEFIQYKDVKVRWTRTYRWADFKVSDYLVGAPDDVLESLAESIFMNIFGQESSFPEKVKAWLTRPEFCRHNQCTYLSRSAGLSESSAGTHKDLIDSYNRLVGAGLVENDPDIALRWSPRSVGAKAARCSVLMKTVTISDALDRDDVPDYVLDYTLYHELCHIMLGYDPQGSRHSDEMLGLENRFDGRINADLWLKKLGIYV